MKNILVVLLLCGASITAHAGFKLLTTEMLVSTVLMSSELSRAKSENKQLSSLRLKNIAIQSNSETKLTEVYLTYQNDGAPCTVKFEVKAINTVPKGAAGVNMVAKIDSVKSVCAVYSQGAGF